MECDPAGGGAELAHIGGGSCVGAESLQDRGGCGSIRSRV